MANNMFGSVEDVADALPRPISLTKLKDLASAGKKVCWHSKADLSFGYDPFLVFIHALNGNSATFQFVNCENGSLIGATYPIVLDDVRMVHAALPSTSRSTIGNFPDERVVFLMLNPRALQGNIAIDAAASNASAMLDGKWPNTALDERTRALTRELESVKSAFSRLLRELEQHPSLSEDAISFYKHQAGLL